jgi:hypothetical protein
MWAANTERIKLSRRPTVAMPKEATRKRRSAKLIRRFNGELVQPRRPSVSEPQRVERKERLMSLSR